MIYIWVLALAIIWFFWKLNFTSKQVVETGNVSKIVDFKDKPERFTVIIFVIGLLSVIAVFKEPAPQEPQRAVYVPAPMVDGMADARKEVAERFKSKQEKLAKDATWTSDDIFKVGVINNGTSRSGYAQYVCSVLDDYGFKGKGVQVHIIDIVKLVNTNKWETIGLANCS